VQLQSFFENDMQYGQYIDKEFQKNFANLVDMKELPDSSKDRQVIRLLGQKHIDEKAFDFRADQEFVKRFFDSYNHRKEEENRKSFKIKKTKIHISNEEASP
jgi:hypothetical protein